MRINYQRVGVCSIICAIIGVWFSSSLHAADLTVASDATWRAINAIPPAGWNTNVVFNDSDSAGWENAFKSPSGDNIWYGSNLSNQGPNQAWFRHIFTLTDAVSSAAGDFFFDDDGEGYINGHLVISDSGGGAVGHPGVVIDSSFFVIGQNLISIHGIDTQGPFNNIGVNLRISTVPEPGSIGVIGAMLSIAAFRGNRRRRH